jgi:SAM-dependent methyltransferase
MKRLLAGFRTTIAVMRWMRSAPPPRFKTLRFRSVFKCIQRGDLAWPSRIAPWVRGRRVLDVGCGKNLQSIGFLAAGARSYTGLDRSLDLDSTILKDSRGCWSRRTEVGLSPKDLMTMRPQVKYVRATIGEFAKAAAEPFDVIAMHNVTEHLMDLAGDLAHLSALIRPGGLIVFRHPNYYSWHGHHCRPRSVSEIDTSDQSQAAVMDWAHTRLKPDESTVHAWIQKTQNCIRLDDLRALIARHFCIQLWEETESTKRQGIDRLTAEVLARYPEFSRRDLATKCVFVVAQKNM